MTGRLQDSVALVTGSDSGIGQATAIEFAKEGADVVVNYLDDEEGARHTREKVEAAGRCAIVVGADVSDEDQVGDMFDRAVEEFGAVDILVNNAGVDASGTKVADLSTEVWDRAIKTNVYGYFYCCRRFINIRKGAGGEGRSSTSPPSTRSSPGPEPQTTIAPRERSATSPAPSPSNSPRTR